MTNLQGNEGFINPPDPKRNFTIKKCDICVFDRLAYDLFMDVKIIQEMVKELPENSNRGAQALWAGNQVCNAYNPNDREYAVVLICSYHCARSWKTCKAIASKFFSATNGASQHTMYAAGHCHIDVAWLWPYGETKRKAARSFASQIRYMEDYPNYKFAQSQAQLYDWVKLQHPKLFEKIKQKVKDGQFIPVGGTWVEMCGILPGGEGMARQFLYGQHFFKKEFGKYCSEFWLPDSFGTNVITGYY